MTPTPMAPAGFTRLSVVNAQISEAPYLRAFMLVVTLLLSFILIAGEVVLKGDINAPPSEIGDGHDYDMIGFAISKGKGFATDWEDPEFRAPYQRANSTGTFNDLLNRTGRGSTAYRPPFVPALIATSHLVFGRQFWPIRFFGIAATAIGITITCLLVLRRYGIVPAFITVFYLVSNDYLLFYSGLISTEAPAFLVVCLLLSVMLRFARSPGLWNAVWIGACLGVGCLIRTAFAMWVPIIIVTTMALARIHHPVRTRTLLKAPALILVAFLAVSGPWMVRNCLVLESLQPLGSMGAINLPVAYSDKAFESRGVWFNIHESGMLAPLSNVLADRDRPLEAERVSGRFASQMASDWIWNHPLETAALPFFKAKSLWAGGLDQRLMILLAIGFTASLLLQPAEAIAFGSILVSCTFSVALTWDVGDGRFLMPVQQVIAIFLALGLWCLLILILELAVVQLATARRLSK